MGSWPSGQQVIVGMELKRVFWDLRAREKKPMYLQYWGNRSGNSRLRRNTKSQRTRTEWRLYLQHSRLSSTSQWGFLCGLTGPKGRQALTVVVDRGTWYQRTVPDWWCSVLCSETSWAIEIFPPPFSHRPTTALNQKVREEVTVSVRNRAVFCWGCFFCLPPLYLLYSHLPSDPSEWQQIKIEAEVQEAMFPLVSMPKMTLYYDGPQNLAETIGRLLPTFLKSQTLPHPQFYL